MNISGKIGFSGTDPPTSFPTNSTLVVKFEDTSRMDAAAVTLGRIERDLAGHTGTIEYSLEATKPTDLQTAHYGFTVSATVNMGWKPRGQEWIKQGDWLTTTSHPVSLTANLNDYQVDIELEKCE